MAHTKSPHGQRDCTIALSAVAAGFALGQSSCRSCQSFVHGSSCPGSRVPVAERSPLNQICQLIGLIAPSMSADLSTCLAQRIVRLLSATAQRSSQAGCGSAGAGLLSIHSYTKTQLQHDVHYAEQPPNDLRIGHRDLDQTCTSSTSPCES